MQPGWRFAAVHAALALAIWLGAVAVYAVAWWGLIDAAVAAALIATIRRQPLPWRAIGAAVAVGFACVAASQLAVPHTAGVWLDESNYLATVRAGTVVRDGMLPFNLRWLAPVLAAYVASLPAVNFGALVVTASYLVLLLVRLGVRWPIALASPVFLLSSYLGVYAASNRLVVDPLNYAAAVIVFHLLIRRAHWRYLPVALLVAACNSEKVIYWLPVIAVAARLRGEPWRQAAVAMLRAGWPALAYLAAIVLYLRGSQTHPTPLFLENLDGKMFQAIWFPFGAFTIYALLAVRLVERWLLAILVLLVPIVGQTLIAYDTERMVAYAFIVYIPLGAIYLSRALRGHVLLGLLVAVAIALHYGPHKRALRRALTVVELALVAVVVLRSRSSPVDGGSARRSDGSSGP
jgi:hypothetical protein